MKKIQKELVTTLLKAIIEDGKAGVNNAVQDLNVDGLSDETSKINYAVEELINLNKDEDGFNFYIFDKWLRKSNPGAKSIECCIREMLSFYGEGRTTFDFKESEINELVELMSQQE